MKKLLLLGAVVIGFVLWSLQGALAEPPVLMYHFVDEPQKDSSVHVSPAHFERQMEFLKLHRYRVVPLEELARDIQEGKRIPRKTVAITFDDGTVDNFRNAFPVLRKMGFPATIFMITDNIGRPGWLSEEDLKILDESGVRIGSHTVNHAFLPKLLIEDVRKELSESRSRLEGILGHPVTLFSYPAGGMTQPIREAVREAGYTLAVTTNYAGDKKDVYGIRRVKITDRAGNLFNFWAKTSGFYHLGKKRVSYPGHEGYPGA